MKKIIVKSSFVFFAAIFTEGRWVLPAQGGSRAIGNSPPQGRMVLGARPMEQKIIFL